MTKQTYQIPIVSSMSPDASTVGCRITVIGANLQYTSATVGGVAAEVEYKNPTSIIVIVPADAISGPVVVFNDTGAAQNAPKFTVTVEVVPPPVVSSPPVAPDVAPDEHKEAEPWDKWKKHKK